MRCLWIRRPYVLLWVGGAVMTVCSCTLDTEGGGLVAPDAGSAGMAASGGSGGMVDASAGSGGVAGAAGVGGTGAVAGGGMAGFPDDSGPGGAGGVGATGGAGGATGGTGGTTYEQCDDGVDNDGDGATDCADDECEAMRYLCTPPIPEEWTGYFRIRVSSNADPAPDAQNCPSGSAPERYFTGKAEAAACGACTCGELSGTVCAPPGIACDYESGGCDNAVDRPELVKAGCQNLPTGSVSCHLTGANAVETPGSCEPSPAVPDFPNKLPFTEVTDACYFDSATVAAGCDGDDLCIAPGASAYAGALCVMYPDDSPDVKCPPRWDEKAPLRLYKAEDVTDMRGCEACTCAPDLDALDCVGGAYEIFDRNSCTDCGSWDLTCKDETHVSSQNCKNVSDWADGDTLSMQLSSRPLPENAKCNAGGGSATGLVETSKGVTLCCLTM